MEKKFNVNDYKVGMKLRCLKGFLGFYKDHIYTVSLVGIVSVRVKDDNLDCSWPFHEEDTIYNLADHFEIIKEENKEETQND